MYFRSSVNSILRFCWIDEMLFQRLPVIPCREFIVSNVKDSPWNFPSGRDIGGRIIEQRRLVEVRLGMLKFNIGYWYLTVEIKSAYFDA